MEITERLGLPLLAPGQSQKELLHNEALQLIEMLVAASVEEPARNDPPAEPATGTCYLIGVAPTGNWAQYPEHLAAFTSAGWRFLAPVAGMAAIVKPSGLTSTYGASGWETGVVRAQRIEIGGLQVIGSRAAAVGDPAGGTLVDAEARAALSQILSALRSHGMIAPE